MARGKELLTVAAIKATKPPAKLHDGQGLYCEIVESGGDDASTLRRWLFRYTAPNSNKRRWMGLGSFEAVSLKQARDAADEARKLLRAGVDPIDKRKVEKITQAMEAAQSRTFKEAALEFLEAKRADWTSKKHAKIWLSTLDDYAFSKIGGLPVSHLDTTRQGVAYIKAVLTPIWREKPETARRVRQRIEAVLEYASAHGYRHGDNPAALARVQHMMGKSARQVTHRPALPYEQIADFMPKLRAVNGLGARALELTILCATRTTETLGAMWSEVDLSTAVWEIPGERMKMKRSHRIPLSRQAVAMLTLLRKADPHGKYVFPGQGTKRRPLSGMTMLKVLERMERTEVTVHGFRSTFRTWAGECTSVPREVCEMALAHIQGDRTEQAYARGDLFAKRATLMQLWADACDAASGGEVVKLDDERKTRSA
ncbi:integrase [alpha proteobacterium U9-1i]|nr:integrase [alpha proteobacterium U9-1i]